jgi:hypothetical protein
VQGNPLLALAEINDPVTDDLQNGKEVAAGNDDDDGGMGEGVGGEPVIPLGKVIAILIPHLAVAAFGGTHGTELQHIVTDTVSYDQVKKQY